VVFSAPADETASISLLTPRNRPVCVGGAVSVGRWSSLNPGNGLLIS